MRVELTNHTPLPESAIEYAACNCYNSNPTIGCKIMQKCIETGHTSVTEFATFTFHIEGVSRALLAQLTRHRHAGYAVRSQRYCVEENFGYVTPKSIEKDFGRKFEYDTLMKTIQNSYNELIKDGVPAEDARMVLPNACETVLEVTMNMRALMNFMNERLCSRAQWEIRELAKLMKKEIEAVSPLIASYLVPKCEKHGKQYAFCPESSSCGRYITLKKLFEEANKDNPTVNSND